MKVNEFINRYKALNKDDKTVLIKEHIVNKYIPYEKKIAVCREIINQSDYSIIKGKQYYSPNTPIRFMYFCITLLDIYTDLELEIMDDDKRDVCGGFNILEENGFFDVLFEELGREYKIMQTVLNMIIKDTVDKENSITLFLQSKFDSMEILYNTALPYIRDNIVKFPNKD